MQTKSSLAISTSLETYKECAKGGLQVAAEGRGEWNKEAHQREAANELYELYWCND